MESLFAIAGFLTVAAITPGPNNIVVLTAAKRGGLAATIPAMLGVISGSLGLLVLVWAGARAAFDLVPSLRLIVSIIGAFYIGGLGVTLIWQTVRHEEAERSRQAASLPTTALGLAIFQFLNPKAWVLVVTATAVTSDGPFGFVILALLLVVICSFCLTLWASVGSVIAGYLKEERSSRWFDCTMGLLLIGSAGLLLLET